MKKHPVALFAFPCAMLLTIGLVLPVGYIFAKSLQESGLEYFIKFFTDKFYLGILGKTVFLALEVTFFTLLLGYPTGYFIARTKSKHKDWLIIGAVFPFLISAVIRAYGWVVILGDNGIFNQILAQAGMIGKPIKIMYTRNAVLVGLVHLLLPHMILSVAAVVQNIDPNIEYAADSLGASKLQTFSRVTLPLSVPGIITGCILVFVSCMTAYVTPKLLGGSRYPLMSTLVYLEAQVNFRWDIASAVSFILLFAVILFLVVINIATNPIMDRLGGGKRV